MMQDILTSLFAGRTPAKKGSLSRSQLIELLQTSPQALEEFESAYKVLAINTPSNQEGDLFGVNAKLAAENRVRQICPANADLEDISKRIVMELCSSTSVYRYTDADGGHVIPPVVLPKDFHPVTNKELLALPEQQRPWITGSSYRIDCDPQPSKTVLWFYRESLKARNKDQAKKYYAHFRQGLDLLDLDPVLYEVLGMNPNSIGNWLPSIAESVRRQGFFRIPDTTVVKVALPILQLSRLEYETIPASTIQILDRYCSEMFNLDESKEYFIKTGTFSSKYDFRNAKVSGAKEVRELGEYLLFISHQASMLASPLNNMQIYGAATTNEWVVREYIQDVEHNPCIYKGLPMHTEYRVFVDFDSKEVLGISPYWEPKMMKARFNRSNSVHDVHDQVVYTTWEPTLMGRYNANKEIILAKVNDLLQFCPDLVGQWSIDIMQNGDTFWLIDMALAANSALRECIPNGRLRQVNENWIPKLG